MAIRYNLSKSRDSLYTDWLDILLEWGQIQLLIQDNDLLLQELEGRWEYLRAIQTPFDTGVEMLEGNIDGALSLLHGKVTVDIDMNDAGPIMEAMHSLDQVVFLSEALDSFPAASHIPVSIHRRAEALLRKVTIDKTPPSLRLIPLNHWRKDIMKLIPVHVRYLFPWYAVWTDLPIDFLDILSDHWEAAEQGKAEALGIDAAELKALMVEIGQDIPLLNRIRRDARLFDSFPPAALESFSHRLREIRADEISLREIPDNVKVAGLLLASQEVIQGCFSLACSDLEKEERRFLAAFCTPFLSDEKCLAAFDETEHFLSGSHPASFPSDSTLHTLWLWSKGSATDGELADKCYGEWDRYLAEAIERIDISAAYEKAFLCPDESPSASDVSATGRKSKMTMVAPLLWGLLLAAVLLMVAIW